MPRGTRTQPKIVDSEIRDESLPGMEGLAQDPKPGTRSRAPRGTAKATGKQIAHRSPKTGRAVSKEALKAQVTDELYGFASLLVGVWGFKDPDCAGTLTEEVRLPDGRTEERLLALVRRCVDMMARSDKLLSTLAVGGIITEVIGTGTLLMPVLKQVWQAHGPGGHGHKEEETFDASRYPAPQLQHS